MAIQVVSVAGSDLIGGTPHSAFVAVGVQADPPPPTWGGGFMLPLRVPAPSLGPLNSFLSQQVASDGEAKQKFVSALSVETWRCDSIQAPGPPGPFPMSVPPTLKPVRAADGTIGIDVTFAQSGLPGAIEQWVIRLAFRHSIVR